VIARREISGYRDHKFSVIAITDIRAIVNKALERLAQLDPTGTMVQFL
jgi:hypothetical protein